MLLDVDGVLNALPRGRTEQAWHDWRRGYAEANGASWPITWSPSVVSCVLGWRERGLAEVQWLTTWGHDANLGLRSLLGMPELPVAGTYEDVAAFAGQPDAAPEAHASVTPAAPDALTGQWWKFDVVRALLRTSPGRRLVWLDDDLARDEEIRAWVRKATDCLLVAPHPETGLVRADLDAVTAFLTV